MDDSMSAERAAPERERWLDDLLDIVVAAFQDYELDLRADDPLGSVSAEAYRKARSHAKSQILLALRTPEATPEDRGDSTPWKAGEVETLCHAMVGGFGDVLAEHLIGIAHELHKGYGGDEIVGRFATGAEPVAWDDETWLAVIEGIAQEEMDLWKRSGFGERSYFPAVRIAERVVAMKNEEAQTREPSDG